MSKSLTASAIGLALILQAPSLAQTTGTQGLAAGIHQVEEGQLEAAVITLDDAARRLSGEKRREKDLATAHVYLGVAYLGLGQPERAKASLRDAWRTNSDLALDPKKFSLRVRQLYEEASEEARRAAGAAVQAAGTTPGEPVPAASAGNARQKGGGHSGLILLGVGGAALAGGAVALAGGGSDGGQPSPSLPSTSSIALTDISPVSGSTIVLPGGTVAAGSGLIAVGLAMTLGQDVDHVGLGVHLRTASGESCAANHPDNPQWWTGVGRGWTASYRVTGFQVLGELPCDVTSIRAQLSSSSIVLAEETFPVSWRLTM